MDAGIILELLKYGETINLECKKAESTLPNAIYIQLPETQEFKSCSA